MPSKSRRDISYDRSESALPDLNASTLKSLAQKIQDSFNQPSKTITQPEAGKRTKEKTSKISKRHEDTVGKKFKLKSAASQKQNYQEGQLELTEQGENEQMLGKKRLRNGQVKSLQPDGKEKVSRGKKTVSDPKAVKQSTSRGGALEEEVLALGGTTDDLELLKDAASDSELDGDSGTARKAAGMGLKQELLQLVEGFGINKTGNQLSGNEDVADDEIESRKSAREARKRNQEDGSKIRTGANADSKAHIRFDVGVPQPKIQNSKSEPRSKAKLLVQPRSEWHSIDMPPIPEATQGRKSIPSDLLARLQQHARALLEKENAEYATQYGSASTEQKFYSTLMSAGTLSDKISALTLSVQESPLHNMKALENLLNLAGKRSRDQAVNVLGALKDLFGPGNLLPSGRRLRNFANQPYLFAAFDSETSHSWTSSVSLPGNLQEVHLVVFAYEDWLKSIFFEMLQLLESWCNDEVIYARGKAVEYIASLLKDKPEQETNLLRLIVNKLGDSDRKIASKASYNILQLETSHPLMKSTIVAAIESDSLFRPNQSLHAQYFAVITLNQTVLSAKEEELARKLLNIYFDLFAKLLKKPEVQNHDRNVSATGKNIVIINKKGQIQGGGGPAGKKALKKQKAAEKSTAVEDDLREKMLSAILTGINRAIPYTTSKDDFFEKHMETLYRITHSANFNTSIQALMLIQQIDGVGQGSQDRLYRVLYESLLDQRLLTSSKQALYLNLLFKALRSDLNLNRVKAFVKRLLQVIAMHQPPLVCGVLYLVRELEKIFPALAIMIDKPEEDASDDEEAFRDVDDASETPTHIPTPSIRSSLIYDPRKRDPVHANASASSLWELSPLVKHYHPSVALFATRVIDHDPMPQKPDLHQDTLISFLDRFVYKNPKAGASVKAKGPSIMQPLSSGDDGSILLPAYSRLANTSKPLNSDMFWRQEDKNVGAHEVFFHKYFREIKSKEEKKREKKAKKVTGGNDEESGSDEEEELGIWKALVESRPEIEGDDSDVDMDFSDDEAFAAAMDVDEDDLPILDDTLLSEDENIDTDSSPEDRLAGAGLISSDNLIDSSSPIRQIDKTEAPGEKSEKRIKRRKMKGLPTFASADDYAKLLAEGSEGDDGSYG